MYKQILLFSILIQLYVNVLRCNETKIKINDYYINGVTLSDGNIRAYLGIKYATNSEKENRFMNSQFADVNSDVIGNVRGVPCYLFKRGKIIEYDESSEDCLNFDIYLPANKAPNTLLPLMVYYTNKPYDLVFIQNYLSKGMAVAIVHFREGVFGYFYTGEDSKPNDYGHSDISLSLQWIHKYKSNFNITGYITLIAEEDSASQLSWALERDDVKANMFNKLILLNGNKFSERSIPSKSARVYSARLLKQIDCHIPSYSQATDCLKTKSIEEIKKALDSMEFDEVDGMPFRPFSEVKEKPTLKKNYVTLLGISKNIMSEYKSVDEFNEKYTYRDFKIFLHKLINDYENVNAPLVRRLIMHDYLYTEGNKTDTYNLWQISRRILFDKVFRSPLKELAYDILLPNKKNKIWLFEYEVVNAFETCVKSNFPEYLEKFCQRLNEYIIRFVLKGAPTENSCNPENPTFPMLGSTKRNYFLQLKDDGTVEWDFPFYQRRVTLWNNLIPFLNKLELVGKRLPMADIHDDLFHDQQMPNFYEEDDYQKWHNDIIEGHLEL
uniref:COesterase domain-containing protein n=1 Tax=Strongyloides papillosus TaxID=174720 RepID=A0A0N5C5P5_STREA